MYSEDLKIRVINYYKKYITTVRKIAIYFEISKSSCW